MALHERGNPLRAADRLARSDIAQQRGLLLAVILLAGVVLLTGSLSISARSEHGTPSVATPTGDAAWSDLSLRGMVNGMPAPPAVVELSRVHLASGATWEIVAPGPVLYGVEEGALGIRVDGSAVLTRATDDGTPGAAEAAIVGVDFTLRRGDQMLILAGTPYTVGNDGREPAAYLSLVIFPMASAIPSWLPDAERPPGVDVQPLAADVTTPTAGTATGLAEIAVERATLAPGEQRVMPPADVALVVVEAGTLIVIADQDSEQTYHAGEVARIDPQSRGIVRNGGDASLDLLTVEINTRGVDDSDPAATPTV